MDHGKGTHISIVAVPADSRPGEVIVAVAGRPVPAAEDLVSVLATLKPGQRVDVDLLRQGGAKATVSVTLGKQRDARQAAG